MRKSNVIKKAITVLDLLKLDEEIRREGDQLWESFENDEITPELQPLAQETFDLGASYQAALEEASAKVKDCSLALAVALSSPAIKKRRSIVRAESN